jgi:hypothetical protein
MDRDKLARLYVLRRSRPANQIEFECPSCQKPVTLGSTSVTDLEAGYRVVSSCRGCLSTTIVSLASLGGFLWAQEQP